MKNPKERFEAIKRIWDRAHSYPDWQYIAGCMAKEAFEALGLEPPMYDPAKAQPGEEIFPDRFGNLDGCANRQPWCIETLCQGCEHVAK